MAEPATRETLKQYALRALGKPVIEINVDDDQLEDRIDEAVQYFQQYHYDGIRRTYLKYKLSAADKTRLAAINGSTETATDSVSGNSSTWYEDNNYLVVPSSIISVINIFPFSDKGNLNLFDVRYQLRLNDLYDFSSTSVINYDIVLRHLDFLDHILVGEKQWGANLSKFNGVAMVGGVTLNGQQIYSEAIQDIEKLENEIRSSYELNPTFMIG